MFTLGNIVADSFQEEWLPVTDRANAIEVTFFDSALDYSRQTVTIYAQDFDTAGHEINTMQATLYGCVTRDLAIKYGKFLINSNKYLTLTCSFEADVDAIACVQGDVIEVAHDVPQWGYSGRVVSSGNSTVTVDRDIDITGATHYVRVKHQDDDTFEEKEIASVDGTGRILTISGTWGKNPALHALYSVGHINAVVKLFRVLRISRSQELRRKITCLEYVAEIYEDGATIPDPVDISDLPRIAGLTATEVYRGGSETKVYLQWRGYALFWNVYYRRSGSAWTLFKRVYNPSCEIGGLDYGILYECAVTGTDNPTDGETVSITLRGKIDPPGNVPSITATELSQDISVYLEWGAVTDFDLWGYELRYEYISEPSPYPNFSANWTTAMMLFKGNARNFTWKYQQIGAYCFHVRAVDAFGNYSTASTTTIVDIGVPEAPEGSYIFSGPNAVLSWSIPVSAFSIDHYNVAYGSAYDSAVSAGTTKGTTFSVNVTWGGSRRYWITAVDVAGNEGTPEFVDVDVLSPGAVSALTPRVIDNNVLLYWTAPTTGSLPISYYAVSRGDSYQTSTDVGTVNGTFSTVFETQAGSYIYWVVAVDSAGTEGAATGIPASVNQPPDYVLLESWADDFSGTKASAILDGGILYAPINITETYQEHFVNNSFGSPFEQVMGDYPAWIMPVPTTATYTRIFNYGALITPLTKITLEVSRDDSKEWGTTTITPSIEVGTDGVNWGTPVEAYTALESGFQYVRVILSFAGTGADDIAAVSNIIVKLDLKQKSDAGRVEVATNGVQVDFNETFIDITSIIVTAEGTTAIFAIYDFTDAPYPTHFHIYLFDAAGSDASGAGKYVSWAAKGV
jgi:predicted phage tail protein